MQFNRTQQTPLWWRIRKISPWQERNLKLWRKRLRKIKGPSINNVRKNTVKINSPSPCPLLSALGHTIPTPPCPRPLYGWPQGESWDKNGSVRGGNVDYSRYPAVSLRIYAPISRPSYRQDWTSTSFASYLRQQILAYADTAWYASHVLPLAHASVI